MRTKNIFNTIFLSGLILLLINDHFLKDIYGNWLTGKLSDFAGILILPLFLKCLLPISTRKAALVTFLCFLFWKSPLSQPMIDAVNSLGIVHWARVVDYTDYLAFLMLPVAIYVMDHINRFVIELPSELGRKIVVNIVMLTAFIAFTSTSDDDRFDFPEAFITDCCVGDPVQANVGNGRIFIPTAFTPDGNGVNDFFQISADSNILMIDTFLVLNPIDTDTFFNETNIADFTPENGFDGVIGDTVVAVQYDYQIVVTSKDNVTLRFVGKICCLPCTIGSSFFAPDSLNNCAFSSQYDPAVGFDASISSGENLNCFF